MLFVDGHEDAWPPHSSTSGEAADTELDTITSAALTSQGCAGWTVCIYNPDLDPDRTAAGRIVRHIDQSAAKAPHS